MGLKKKENFNDVWLTMSGRIEEGKNEKQVLILLYVNVCVGEKKMVIGKVWNNKDVKNDICLCFRNV